MTMTADVLRITVYRHHLGADSNQRLMLLILEHAHKTHYNTLCGTTYLNLLLELPRLGIARLTAARARLKGLNELVTGTAMYACTDTGCDGPSSTTAPAISDMAADLAAVQRAILLLSLPRWFSAKRVAAAPLSILSLDSRKQL